MSPLASPAADCVDPSHVPQPNKSCSGVAEAGRNDKALYSLHVEVQVRLSVEAPHQCRQEDGGDDMECWPDWPPCECACQALCGTQARCKQWAMPVLVRPSPAAFSTTRLAGWTACMVAALGLRCMVQSAHVDLHHSSETSSALQRTTAAATRAQAPVTMRMCMCCRLLSNTCKT